MNRREFLSGATKVAALVPLAMYPVTDPLPYEVPDMTTWGGMTEAQKDQVKHWIIRNIDGGYNNVTSIVKDGANHVLVTRIHRIDGNAHAQARCPTGPWGDPHQVCVQVDRIKV